MTRTTGPVRLVVGVFMAAVGTVSGADFNWLRATGGNWSATANWNGGVVATGAANAAVFPASVSGAVINVDGDSDIGTLRFLPGSQFTLNGVNVLGGSAIEVLEAGQTVTINAPLSAPGTFTKQGPGTAVFSSLAAPSAGVKVADGTVESRTLNGTMAPSGVELGDLSSPAGGTASFLLTTDLDYIDRHVGFGGYNQDFIRILGGANTAGTVYYADWITTHANEAFLTAAAGGQVDIERNILDRIDGSAVTKIGAGAVRIRTWGNNESDRAYYGGTTVRQGTLIVGEDDIGRTTNGFVLANGRTGNGAGGCLGYNDYAQAVQLGDVRYSLTGSGSDIWGTSDQFHYLWGSLTNDGQLVVRVALQQDTHAWAKSGLMLRESLDAGSRHIMMAVTPRSGATFQWRPGLGGECTNVGAAAKAWLKLTRAGDVFSGYVSDDGVTWTLVASVELAMDSVLQAGLAVTAHSNTMLARTDFAAVSGLPAALANDDVGGVALTGSGAFAGTAGKDDVALLAENTRWIGHALQVNAVGRTVAIGARDGGVCTFAGPIALQRDVVVTAPAGGAALFSGAIAGAGGVIKTGAGVVGWGGANTYAGATVISNGTLRLDAAGTLPANGAVTIAGGTLDLNGYTLSNGTVTIRGGTITGGDLAGTACEVVGANTLAVALSGGASLTKSGAGTLLITAPQAYTGPTLVAEGVLRLAVPGLYEGRLPNWFNRLDPNPRTSIQLTTRYANSTDRAPWVDNSTYVYSGLINNSATQDVVYTFAEQFDDNVMLRIDGEIVLNDTQWNVQTSTNVTLSPGVHAFDLRVGQGGWDVGPSAGGVGGTTGLGFACSTNGGATWLALTDSGAGNFLDTGLAQPFLPAGTSVTVADGATLDLNMATQTVAGVGGSGTVRNGELAVTGSISPAGPNAIGALTVDGNLTVGEGVVHDWTFNVVAADSVHVSGVLTLPAVATVNLNSLGGTVSSRHIVLYTFGSYRGPARLNGWTVSGSSKVKVDLVNREVVLTGGGTVMVLH